MRLFANTGSRAWLIAGLWLGLSTAQAAINLPDFTPLVEANSAAVVNISTTQKVKPTMRGMPPQSEAPELPEMPELPEGSPFGEFFRYFFGDPRGGDMPEFDARSLGSGFIISKDGYVITNNHVVKAADEIIVRLTDRREFPAKVIGTDPRSDLAVIKIEANDLPVAKLGDSRDVKVGEWVLAIGSPFGFDHSVTAGIVSAMGRSLPSENYVPFIQTDVAINPGNSGGPLINMEGEVIGVNSQIYSRTGGYMGLSFAIPMEVAMDVVDQLKTHGRVTRGWLGVLIQDVTRDLAESFGMQRPQGALVAKVLPDSPAAQAGIRTGDVIVSFNGQDLDRSSSLPPLVGRAKIGEGIPVGIVRDGERQEIKIEIGELPAEQELELTQGRSEGRPSSNNRLGIAVSDLSAEEREQAEVAEGGVLVRNVDEGPAREAGIRAGDVLLRVGKHSIDSVQQLGEILKELPAGEQVPILVQRRGNPMFLALKLPE